MKRFVVLVALGAAGLLAAVGMTVGALALAGDDAGSVLRPDVSAPRSTAPPSGVSDRATPTPSEPPKTGHGGGSDDHGSDDHGGSDHGGDDSQQGSSSGDSGGSGSDDSSGHGSGDDHSGDDD